MELRGRVVDEGLGDLLALIVLIGLGDFYGIVTLAHGKSNELLRDGAHLLGAIQGGGDLAVPDQLRDLVAQECLTLVSRTAELAFLGHGCFPPCELPCGATRRCRVRCFSHLIFCARGVIPRCGAGSGPVRRASAPLPRATFCPGCALSSCLPHCAARVLQPC